MSKFTDDDKSLIEGLFGLSIDVEALAVFFPEWTINQDYPGDDNVLLISPEGGNLRFSEHKVSAYTSFAQRSGENREFTESSEALNKKFPEATLETAFREGITRAGLRHNLFELSEKDGYISGAHIEGRGFRYGYISADTNFPIVDLLENALKNFPWLDLPQKNVKTYRNPQQLRQALKPFCEQYETLFDEILESIHDDDVFLNHYNLIDAAANASDSHPLLRSLIHFAIANKDLCVFEWVDLVALVKPGGLDDSEAYREIIKLVTAEEPSVDRCLMLACETNNVDRRNEWLQKAIVSADIFHDVGKLVENSHINHEHWPSIESIISEKICDEEFNKIGTVVHPLKAAVVKQFIAPDEFISFIEKALTKHLSPSVAFKIAEELFYLDSTDGIDDGSQHSKSIHSLVSRYIKHAEEHASDASLINEISDFIEESLEDNERAKLFRDRYVELLEEDEKQQSEIEAEADTVINMCKCAILVAAIDGGLSDEEIKEASEMRSWIGALLSNREAIEIFERTGNVELAEEKRIEIVIFSEARLFGPLMFVEQVLDDIENISSAEELVALLKLYASRVSDPFHQRLSLWVAEETASADKLVSEELFMLEQLATEFGLDLDENTEYYSSIVLPAINGQLS